MLEYNYCLLPWNSISVRQDGKVRICCMSHHGPNQGVIGNDIESSSSSPLLKDVQNAISQGKFHSECVRCQKEYQSGITPSFKKYPRLEVEKAPSYYDLRLGNRCNLGCRYCHSSTSTFFGGEEFTWYKDKKFWNYLENHMKEIKTLHVEGGEPMLVDEHFDFLEKCICNDRSKYITVEYVTNLTFIPDRSWKIWKEFKDVKFGVSVDTFDYSIHHYIRYPSKLDNVLTNLKKIRKLENSIVWLTCTVSIYNIYYLNDYLKTSEENKIFPSCHPIHKPEYLNIKCLPKRVKDKLPTNPFTEFMYQEDLSECFPEFWKYNDKLDEQRDQKLSEFLPEWYEILREEM